MLSESAKALEIIEYLGLEQIPVNGGWFKLVHHDVPRPCADCPEDCRHANSTTILRLVERETANPWHRLNTTTIWSFLAGGPLELLTFCEEKIARTQVLGSVIESDHRPLVLVPENCWRQLRCLGEWTLSSCICTPGFEFELLELAEKDWVPHESFRH